jgi:hypothetical protein
LPIGLPIGSLRDDGEPTTQATTITASQTGIACETNVPFGFNLVALRPFPALRSFAGPCMFAP